MKLDKISRMEWLPRLPSEILFVIMAAAGGMARYLQSYLEEGDFSPRHLIAHVLISSFSGYMFYQFSSTFDLSAGIQSVMAGMGGWMGVAALTFLEQFIKNKFNGK